MKDALPCVTAEAEEKDKGKKKLKPPRVVRAEAAKDMLRSTAKRAKAETALHLLHAVVAGTNGAHIGLAAADVTGIQVCLCACPRGKVSVSNPGDSLRTLSIDANPLRYCCTGSMCSPCTTDSGWGKAEASLQYFVTGQALQVCDRALRTALAGLQASDADEACAVLAGDALDDIAVATNRCTMLLSAYLPPRVLCQSHT